MARDDIFRLVRTLQGEISDLRRQVKTLQQVPHLKHASIEDGAVRVKDRDGRVTQVIGKQEDDSYGASVRASPVPPAPSVPVVSRGAGSYQVTWDGDTVTGRVPRAFGRTEVWAAPGGDEGDEGENGNGNGADPTEARRVSAIYSSDGGSTTISATSGAWTVWLRMVAADGATYSDFSAPVSVYLQPVADDQTIQARIEELAGGQLEDEVYDTLMARLGEFATLRADNIDAESIHGVHLAVGALDGKTITGALIQTQADPNRGIKLEDGGVAGYDGEGRVNLWLDGESNRLSGELEIRSAEGGTLGIRTYRAEEMFDTTTPDELYNGIGFQDPDGEANVAGIFVRGTGSINFTSGLGRPRAWMGGTWAVQELEPTHRLTPSTGARIGSSPIPLTLFSGWRTSPRAGPPGYVIFGNMIILKGGIRTPSGGDMGPAFSYISERPDEMVRLQAITTNGLGTDVTVVAIEIGTDGYMRVLDGGSHTLDRNLHLDGLSYFYTEG